MKICSFSVAAGEADAINDKNSKPLLPKAHHLEAPNKEQDQEPTRTITEKAGIPRLTIHSYPEDHSQTYMR